MAKIYEFPAQPRRAVPEPPSAGVTLPLQEIFLGAMVARLVYSDLQASKTLRDIAVDALIAGRDRATVYGTAVAYADLRTSETAKAGRSQLMSQIYR